MTGSGVLLIDATGSRYWLPARTKADGAVAVNVFRRRQPGIALRLAMWLPMAPEDLAVDLHRPPPPISPLDRPKLYLE